MFRGRGKNTKGAATVEMPEGTILNYTESALYPARDVEGFREFEQDENIKYQQSLLISKSITSSLWFLEAPKQKSLIYKYSDHKYSDKTAVAKKAFRDEVRELKLDPLFFPEELQSVFVKNIKKKSKSKVQLGGIDLAKIALLTQDEEGKAESVKDSENDEDSVAEDSEMDEEADDYAVDYYDEDLDVIGSDNDLGES